MDIVFDKTEITKSVGALLWKYGNTIEGADNFKLESNVKIDLSDNADKRTLDDSFFNRTNELANIMREFVSGDVSVADTGQTPTYNVTIPITMSTTWKGQQRVLKSHCDKYVIDGMMADWLNATAPNEAALYSLALKKDEENIIDELYAV